MTVRTADGWIVPFSVSGATLERVGGKGASLARLVSAGFPVPPGFVISTDAYRQVIAEAGLQAEIDARVAASDPDALATLEDAAAAIQAAVLNAPMPPGLAAAIGQAYAALGAPPVAVRSSATAEDLPGSSFAGQQETLLNVRGEAALLVAVRRCWASLWTARAIAYRQRMGIDQRTVVMGVVVQQMAPAVVAGVLFTANPTTGGRDELVVNASYGLGEAVVAGEVTPDSVVLDRASLEIRDSSLGTKDVAIVAAPEQGTVRRETSVDERRQLALTPERLRELGDLALRVEALFGGVPQDIEWAVADGRIWLLQSRPITNLPPAPPPDVCWEPPIPGTTWIRRQVVEHMPEPLSPLFAELYLRDGLDDTIDLFVDLLGVPRELMEVIERPFLVTVNGFAYMRASYTFRWSQVLAVLRYTVRTMPVLFSSASVIWEREALPVYLATIEHWRQLDLTKATDEELLDGIRDLARADARYWWITALVIGGAKVSDAIFSLVLALSAPGRGLTSGMFLRGFPSKLVQAEADLETIAARIRANESLRQLVEMTPAPEVLDALAAAPAGSEVLDELRDYFGRYGHQIYTLDFAEPTLGEDPLPVVLSLKAMVGRPHQSALARQAAIVAERERLVAVVERGLDPLRRALFQRVLRLAQRLAPGRDEAFFYVGSAWPTLRGLAHELGRRLTEAGLVSTADDLFYLEAAEIVEASAARRRGEAQHRFATLARERRDLREARKRLHPPPAVPPTYRYRVGPFDLSGFETQRRNLLEDTTLRGFAVSPGRVTAPASVIRSPAEFGAMEPGTILVCPTTTPAWTPLFAQARGLVTDIGGVLAHGSIVAREYGIPAVMGTGNATQRITSGQVITVDGIAGTVSLDAARDNGRA